LSKPTLEVSIHFFNELLNKLQLLQLDSKLSHKELFFVENVTVASILMISDDQIDLTEDCF
jgi:hypothetical protein